MSILGIEYAMNRVVAILQANLPAELDAIDALWADGITLDDIPAAAYFTYRHPTPLISNQYALLVLAEQSLPLQIDSITNTPGRAVRDHIIAVEVYAKDNGNMEPSPLQSVVLRYADAILRVLAVKNITLGGTVFRCVPEGPATFTAVRQQGTDDEPGEFTGSARVPFAVRLFENL